MESHTGIRAFTIINNEQKMRTRASIFFMIAIACVTSAASAQYAAIGTTIGIGPVTAFCRDPYGNSVMNYSGSINQAAMSSVVASGPAIVVDPHVMNSYPTAFQIFTYVHECGHHALGHVVGVNPTPTREFQADCYAAKKTRDLGWLSSAGFNTAMQVLQTFPADSGHPSGPARVANARKCYQAFP